MKNWKVIRPLLRKKFGRDFYFYNDIRIGDRRIKIMGLDNHIEEIKKLGIEVKPHNWNIGWKGRNMSSLIIVCEQ